MSKENIDMSYLKGQEDALREAIDYYNNYHESDPFAEFIKSLARGPVGTEVNVHQREIFEIEIKGED